MRKLKRSEIPIATQALLKKQGYQCPLCGGSLKAGAKKDPVLDHDHTTGAIRDVLCRNCNGIEGKIYNLVRRAQNGLAYVAWIARLSEYWERHKVNQHNLIHPTHLTEEEKRLQRNAKARARRAASRG